MIVRSPICFIIAACLWWFSIQRLHADLIALYRFDEPSGSTANDFFNANNGNWIPGTLAAPD